MYSRSRHNTLYTVLALALSLYVTAAQGQTYRIDPGVAPKRGAGPAQVAPLPPGSIQRIKHADLTITDIYADSKPQGQFWVRIMNQGPDALSNSVARVACFAVITRKADGSKNQSPTRTFKVALSLAPGQAAAYATGLGLDTRSFSYFVRCEVRPQDFNDRNAMNDAFDQTIQ